MGSQTLLKTIPDSFTRSPSYFARLRILAENRNKIIKTRHYLLLKYEPQPFALVQHDVDLYKTEEILWGKADCVTVR